MLCKLWKWTNDDVPDDVLEETNAARYQMLPKKSKRIGNFFKNMRE
jgi:hypothetical protein